MSKVHSKSIAFLYPFGATLNVVKPAVAVLSSGIASFPSCRPVCAFYENEQSGKMIVLGSGHVLTDKYIGKESNQLVLDLLLAYFMDASFTLNTIDSLNPEISDYNMVPELETLCNKPMLILDENEEIPSDYSQLFSKKIKKITNSSLPKINRTYESFQIEKRALKMIKPSFECPFPPLVPAIFPAVFRAMAKPELELFDLDDEFSSIPSKIAKLANRCNDDVDDMDYFIRECGIILGQVGTDNESGDPSKRILYNVVSKVVNFKKIENE